MTPSVPSMMPSIWPSMDMPVIPESRIEWIRVRECIPGSSSIVALASTEPIGDCLRTARDRVAIGKGISSNRTPPKGGYGTPRRPRWYRWHRRRRRWYWPNTVNVLETKVVWESPPGSCSSVASAQAKTGGKSLVTTGGAECDRGSSPRVTAEEYKVAVAINDVLR